MMNGGDTSNTMLLLSAGAEAPPRFARWGREVGVRCVSLRDPRLAEGYRKFEELGFPESPDLLAIWAEGVEPMLTTALRVLRLEHPHIGIIVLSANSTPEASDDLFAVQAGADVVLDPEVPRDRFLFTLNRLLELHHLRTELSYLRRRDASGAELGGLVGSCPQMRDVFGQVLTLCRRSSRVKMPPPVLITGETGPGMGQVARAIHYNGLRRDQALVEVNCASLPGSLVEAELFGNERGAFTGALPGGAGSMSGERGSGRRGTILS